MPARAYSSVSAYKGKNLNYYSKVVHLHVESKRTQGTRTFTLDSIYCLSSKQRIVLWRLNSTTYLQYLFSATVPSAAPRWLLLR